CTCSPGIPRSYSIRAYLTAANGQRMRLFVVCVFMRSTYFFQKLIIKILICGFADDLRCRRNSQSCDLALKLFHRPLTLDSDSLFRALDDISRLVAGFADDP